ncbi:BnaA01g21600D [Brassica napus]|uniref:BnaA01g21600D protein n=1 Tax=Brassica napus TaxID=3708 RepID=A0A078GEQ1_BRANA|nr:BnaA01g21600D [Brassica napus]
MVFVTVHDFHSMCQKHCHYLLKKREHSSSSLGSADSFFKASRSEVLTLFMRSMLLALLFLSFTWLSLLKCETDSTAASKLVESDQHELLCLCF